MHFDVVVVGAGFAGGTAARICAEKGYRVLIIEKRNHIGGNAYDYYNDRGNLIHKYGPHIFHTNSEVVWNFLSRFTKWDNYQHKVSALVDGKYIPVPFNLNSMREVFGESLYNKLEVQLIERFGYGKKIPILELRKSDDELLKLLADYVYNNIFYFYTLKQWGMTPEKLNPEVTNRVPVYISKDDRYFQDRYQGMPLSGYTKLFENMLDHNNIKIMLATDYKEVIKEIRFKKLIYTGPIDYYYDYKYGRLKYRTLNFDFYEVDKNYVQHTAVYNYPNNYDYTRITDFNVLTTKDVKTDVLVKEYPAECGENDIPYYPIPNEECLNQYKKYEYEASKEENVIFIGRLAEYKYYNMDQIVLSAINKINSLKTFA